MHIVGESGAFQLGAQFLKTWRKNVKIVCIVSCQKGKCYPGQGLEKIPHPVVPNSCPTRNLYSYPHFLPREKWWLCEATSNLFLLLSFYLSMILTPLSGIPASVSPLSPDPSWWGSVSPQNSMVGVFVPTEQCGLIFQDKGFIVYEYSIWNASDLCSDPSMFVEVLQVESS